MKHLNDKLPSNKVGLVLILVVFVVVSTIFLSKFKKEIPVVNLENVELLVGRNTSTDSESMDTDKDGLPDWQEEVYGSNSKVADTDGDGTPDGEEIKLKRDPTVKGPNDPLLTRDDLIAQPDLKDFVPGTLTDKVSVDLFSEYMMLKKQGALQPEDEAKLVDDLSQKAIQQSSLKPKYASTDLITTESDSDTINIYGDRVAQVSITYFSKMDSYKSLDDMEYLTEVSKEYKTLSSDLSKVHVPTVAQDIHLKLINQLYNVGVFYEALAKTDSDPVTSIVIINQYKTIEETEDVLYTTLGQYFKNNAIIFSTESTSSFWKNYEN